MRNPNTISDESLETILAEVNVRLGEYGETSSTGNYTNLLMGLGFCIGADRCLIYKDNNGKTHLDYLKEDGVFYLLTLKGNRPIAAFDDIVQQAGMGPYSRKGSGGNKMGSLTLNYDGTTKNIYVIRSSDKEKGDMLELLLY